MNNAKMAKLIHVLGLVLAVFVMASSGALLARDWNERGTGLILLIPLFLASLFGTLIGLNKYLMTYKDE